MTSSKPGPRQVPPPTGGAAKQSNAYARFIPREELAEFAAWTPDTFGVQSPEGPSIGGLSKSPPKGQPPGKSGRADPAPAPTAPSEPNAEQWQARVEESRGQGYQQGYRDGLEALDAAKRQFAQQLSAQMAQVLAAFDDQTQALDVQMARTLVESAVMLARQVVRSEIAQRPELIVQVAEDTIAALILSARHLRLRLNPKDLPLVEESAAEMLRARGVMLQGDASIASGGCIVESDLGQVDARIELRWQQAAAVFGQTQPYAEPAADATPGDDL